MGCRTIEYKPADSEMPERPDMQNMNGQSERPERPDAQNGRHNGNSGLINVISNIINKIVEDYSLSFNTEELTTEKIAEFINEFVPSRDDQNGRPDFQNSGAPEFNGQSMPAPSESQNE